MTQADLAERTGVHRQTQVNYEADKRELPVDYLDAAAKAGIDTEFVVTGYRSDEQEHARQAKNAALSFLLQSLGYRTPQEQLDQAFEIWTSPTPKQRASGGLEGFTARLVTEGPAVQHMLAESRRVDASLLEEVLLCVKTIAEHRHITLSAMQEASMVAQLYKSSAANGGRCSTADVEQLLNLVDPELSRPG